MSLVSLELTRLSTHPAGERVGSTFLSVLTVRQSVISCWLRAPRRPNLSTLLLAWS